MAHKVVSGAALLVGMMLVVGLSSAAVVVPAADQDHNHLPLLSTFKEIQYDVSHNPDGTYVFYFSLPQQERTEQRDADGKVSGSFAFVDRVGQEVSVRYDADEDGYHPESDALPQAPEDTPDVAQAREQFLQYYDQTAKYLAELASDEDDSSSSEESDEEDHESSEEDSSEEDDEDSESEEDEDEDGSESEEEEEEEEVEEEEEEEEEIQKYFGFEGKLGQGFGSRVPQQEVSRAALAQETRKRAAFYPFTAGSFGRRLPSGGL